MTLTLSGCGRAATPPAAVATATATQSTVHPYAYVTFTSGADYDTALRAVTDLGLEPMIPCNGNLSHPDHNVWVRWGAVGVRDMFPNYHFLWVQPTPLAAADWPSRLATTPDVATVDRAARLNCPLILIGTPTPNEIDYLPPDQAGTVAQVTFKAGTSYAQALYAVSNLGLRLADPCFEQAHKNAPIAASNWQPVGQEAGFAARSAMVVATTTNASNQWQAQVQASQVVSGVQTPYAPAC